MPMGSKSYKSKPKKTKKAAAPMKSSKKRRK